MFILKVNTLSDCKDCNLSQDGLRCLLNQDWLPNSQLQELILTHTRTHTPGHRHQHVSRIHQSSSDYHASCLKPSRLIKPCYPIWSDNVPQSSIWYQAVCVSLRFGALLNNGEVLFIGKMESWLCRCPTPESKQTPDLSFATYRRGFDTPQSLCLFPVLLLTFTHLLLPEISDQLINAGLFFHPEKSFGDTVLVPWHHIQ